MDLQSRLTELQESIKSIRNDEDIMRHLLRSYQWCRDARSEDGFLDGYNIAGNSPDAFLLSLIYGTNNSGELQLTQQETQMNTIYLLKRPHITGIYVGTETAEEVTSKTAAKFDQVSSVNVQNPQEVLSKIDDILRSTKTNHPHPIYDVGAEVITNMIVALDLKSFTPATITPLHIVDKSAVLSKIKATTKKVVKPKNPYGTTRNHFNFKKYGILVGSELVSTINPNIVITVTYDNMVSHKGKSYSISALTRQLFGQSRRRGPQYWTYRGVRLSDMYESVYGSKA